MKTLNLSQATAPLTDYMATLDRQPLIVTVDEQPQAALMSIRLADELTHSFNSHPEFIAKAAGHLEANGGEFRVEAVHSGRSLADYIQQMSDRPIIITVDAQATAVLIPIRDADLETASLSLNPSFIQMLTESRIRLKTEGGISLAQLNQELSDCHSPT
ncbi:hypothetical protein B9T07_26975 [Limnospira fusiformis CCALA 023]|uniref:hypothetical protein n=1 Tax=Limnospira platensis TaxID=118562 RepID=UPI00396DBCAD